MADRYAVIGHPVAHSRSPAIHQRFARATGQELEYGRIDATPTQFAEAVEQFRRAGGKGLNVTLPHKETAFRYCRRTSERALAAQAVRYYQTASFRFARGLMGVDTSDSTIAARVAREEGEATAIGVRGSSR